MSRQDLFEHLLSSLHEATLDDAHWPIASALMDEACGSKGNILVSGEGETAHDGEIFFTRCCYRGQRHEDYESEYFRGYHHRDERGPRLRDRSLAPEADMRQKPDLASGGTGEAGSVAVRWGRWSARIGRPVGSGTLGSTRSVTP